MKKQITAQRENLIPCVRKALAAMGVSTVNVVNAINGELAQAECIKHDAAMGDGKTSKGTKTKESAYTVTERESAKWKLKPSIVTAFDTWHCLLAKADNFAWIDTVTIPECFIPWLMKFSSKPLQAEPSRKEDFATHVGEQSNVLYPERTG